MFIIFHRTVDKPEYARLFSKGSGFSWYLEMHSAGRAGSRQRHKTGAASTKSLAYARKTKLLSDSSRYELFLAYAQTKKKMSDPVRYEISSTCTRKKSYFQMRSVRCSAAVLRSAPVPRGCSAALVLPPVAAMQPAPSARATHAMPRTRQQRPNVTYYGLADASRVFLF